MASTILIADAAQMYEQIDVHKVLSAFDDKAMPLDIPLGLLFGDLLEIPLDMPLVIPI